MVNNNKKDIILSKKEILDIINNIKQKLKNNNIIRDMFNDYDVPIEYIDYIPVSFADLNVSARTAKGVIYLNWKLLDDNDLSHDDHYLVHEITHWLQQTTGDKPTQGSVDDTYLDNKYEQEGFQNQTEYMSDRYGDQHAEDYIEKVLDHHEINDTRERKLKRKKLLQLALKYNKNFNKLAGRWGSIITGEWWITNSGDVLFADQDVGDVGHEVIAVDMLLDKDILFDGLKKYYKKQLDSKQIDEDEFDDLNKELSYYENDDYGASVIYFNLDVPDEIGAQAANSFEIWSDLKKDPRLAYAKHEGAILVINNNFYAWKITKQTIEAIQSFLIETLSDDDIPQDAEMLIEEAETNRNVSISIGDFLGINNVGKLWRQADFSNKDIRRKTLLRFAESDFKSIILPKGFELYHGSIGVNAQKIIDEGVLKTTWNLTDQKNKISGGTIEEVGLIWFSGTKKDAENFALGGEAGVNKVRALGYSKGYVDSGVVFTIKLPRDFKLINRYAKLTTSEANKLNAINARKDYDPITPGISLSSAMNKFIQSTHSPKTYADVLPILGYDGIIYHNTYGLLADELPIVQQDVVEMPEEQRNASEEWIKSYDERENRYIRERELLEKINKKHISENELKEFWDIQIKDSYPMYSSYDKMIDTFLNRGVVISKDV